VGPREAHGLIVCMAKRSEAINEILALRPTGLRGLIRRCGGDPARRGAAERPKPPCVSVAGLLRFARNDGLSVSACGHHDIRANQPWLVAAGQAAGRCA
jgi:hypothetical protein